jgi:hypothetical protein
LGIWLSFSGLDIQGQNGRCHAGDLRNSRKLKPHKMCSIEHFTAATAALSAGRREGAVMAERGKNGNRGGTACMQSH